MSASSQKPVDDGLPRTSLSFHTSLNTITEASSIALLNSLSPAKEHDILPFPKEVETETSDPCVVAQRKPETFELHLSISGASVVQILSCKSKYDMLFSFLHP
jgi:hypothetical protein